MFTIYELSKILFAPFVSIPALRALPHEVVVHDVFLHLGLVRVVDGGHDARVDHGGGGGGLVGLDEGVHHHLGPGAQGAGLSAGRGISVIGIL